MFFHKSLSFFLGGKFMNRSFQIHAWILGAALITTSCSGGLDGGNVNSVFGGITSAVVRGPETVELSWKPNLNCSSYNIYQPSANGGNAILTASAPPIKVVYPNVQSDHIYQFAVGCVDTSNVVTGRDYYVTAATWAKYSGLVTSTLDTTGTNPAVVLNWNYATSAGTTFQIFAQQSQVAGDLSTWALTQPGGYATAYSESPICEVTGANSVKLGGSACPSANLTSGAIYNFKIVAKYPDGKYSTDLVGNGTSIGLPSTFTPPNCVLTKTGIGADAVTASLILRCSSGGSSSGGCPIANISSVAYQAQNGARTPVSDTLNGAGTLRIAPAIAATAGNDRVVTGLEIEYTCKATTPNSKSIVRYDGSNPLYPPPNLKYGSTGYEAAPPQAYTLHPSYLGAAIAIGDFNCDGKPDLAVGLPKESYNLPPYSNQLPESGAVKIYYDYAVTANGSITSSSVEYLSFRDLPAGAHFGQSLSAGNINKDVHVSGNKTYSCDDLIIGAPGASGLSGGYRGAAYIFYGQPQGFPQPLDSSGLAVNAATCSGNISSEVCSPVRLQPDMTAYFNVDPGMTNQNAFGGYGNIDEIGFSVAYIRDFNADGYGDIAIGNPNCRWDGEGQNNWSGGPGQIIPPPLNVGCVYVYWGGPQGLQSTYVGKTPNDGASIYSPFVKIYPPIPQENMQFGYSISGGGDVDGRLPVPVPQNGGPGVILAPGNDFVVGAPGFVYSGTVEANGANKGGIAVTPTWTVDETAGRSGCGSGTCPVDPIVMQGAATYNTVEKFWGNRTTPPWNGAWAQATSSAWNNVAGFPVPGNTNLKNSTGIAFLYLGRSAYTAYDLTVTSSNFTLYPNQATNAPTDTSMDVLYSKNLRDRQNGGQYLATKTPATASLTWQQSPKDSFYNCGPRGSPISPNGSGYYKHLSCLAGRNNFSIIYPTSGSITSNFGANVKIAGAAEQNAVALFQLGSVVSASGYATSLSAGMINLSPLSQGNTHAAIRGVSEWELGIQGLNTPGTRDATCEITTDFTSTETLPGGCLGSYTGRIGRSMIREGYSFPSSTWNPAPSATPIMDINKDGYADVIVTANQQVYTYFGNYAADFSYQVNGYAGSASCNVNRINTTADNLFSSSVQNQSYPLNNKPMPYTTFIARSSGLSTPTYQFTSEYPEYILPNTGNFVRAAYLDDTTQGSALTFSYPAISRSTASIAATNCMPQVKSYTSTPTSLAVSDLNADGVLDAAIGFSLANGGNGSTVIAAAATSGAGLAADTNLSATSNGAQLGSSVEAQNWKFIDETARRDLFAGAIGYSNGAGAIYNYSAAGNSTLASTPGYTYLEDNNAPNILHAEYSRIIGDVNGDGYDDIWVPIKRIDSSGNIYYDAMIYYGSASGPLTYTTCIAKQSKIKIAGNAISASDCLGNSTPQVAMLDGVQVRLPQYLSRPTGVTANWALGVNDAGDVNRDGYQDVLITAANTTDINEVGMYLFFGSSSGLINGQPILGQSTNQSPQLVTQNSALSGSVQVGNRSYVWTLAQNSYRLNNRNANFWDVSQHRPIVHGDFNGDGFEDLAIAVQAATSVAHATPWTCFNGMGSDQLCNTYPTPEPAGAYNSPFGGKGLAAVGHIVILYGGPGGYQTPTDSMTGLATDFPVVDETCTDFYGTCTPAVAGMYNTVRSPYNTLVYNSGTGAYTLDTTKTACDPGSASTNHPSYTCTAGLIRSPIFYNDPVNGGMNIASRFLYFGDTLTVADINHDGIDDLIVGSPTLYQPGWASRFASGQTPGPTLRTIFGASTNDVQGKGMVFTYYGAKGAGLVAPDAGSMLGDNGLGLDGTGAIAPRPNTAVFQIYPMAAANAGTAPELDGISEINRGFGSNLTSGDFNGDGYDDIAVTSANGQVYVYYGPLCQVDNAKSTWRSITYLNLGQACLTNTGGVTGVCGTTSGTIGPNDCSLLNLNTTFATNTSTNAVNIAPAPVKELYPQSIFVTGTSASNLMGSTLISRRPVRSPASTTILKNPGNVNGDAEGTSDLLIGTNFQNDPNVTKGNTGFGAIYFGHKTPTAGAIPSLPGLYTQGALSYNGGLTSQVIGGNTYYFYTPVLLRPHTSDGNIIGFFQFDSTMGDLNGDGTGDLTLPSQQINFGADGNATVIQGGGFKLFY